MLKAGPLLVLDPLQSQYAMREVWAQALHSSDDDICPLGVLAQATVGAGLPVLSTLRSLLHTGDAVERIEGVLSGTLSFIFNWLSPQHSFSSIVAEAKAAGYTEPDPREDLSGLDSLTPLHHFWW